jgi:hypothetical protein
MSMCVGSPDDGGIRSVATNQFLAYIEQRL